MAPITPPLYQQANSYPARLDRLMMSSTLTGRPANGPLVPRFGVSPNPSGGMLVTQRGTPDRWVTIAGGTTFVPATSTTGGVYVMFNDAAYDVQTAAAHATLPRKDLIIARVYDAIDDVGSTNTCTIEVLTGTPASSPARPTVPNQATPLAEVLVPANSSSVTNANITDLRQYVVALGGVMPVTGLNGDIPGVTYPGQAIFNVNTKALSVHDGTAWQAIPFGGWTSYTPAITATTTAPALGTGSAREGGYMQIGKLTIVRGNIRFGSSGASAGSGTYRISVPVAAKTLSIGNHQGSAEYQTGAGNQTDGMCRITAGTGWNNIELVCEDTLISSASALPVGTNAQIGFTIMYEAA